MEQIELRFEGMLLKASLFFMLLVQCADSVAAHWVPIPVEDAEREFFVDLDSVTTEGKTVYFWDRIVFKVPKEIDQASGRLIKEKRVYHSVRCGAEEWTLVKGALFDESARFLESIMPASGSLAPVKIKAGTIAAVEVGQICQEARGQ